MATGMSVKQGTKTWNEKSSADEDLTKVSTLSDAQKQKLGAEDMGAVLNKATDPNWVDPSSSKKRRNFSYSTPRSD